MAVVVMAGLAGFGGAHWTDATFTDTQTITGNTLGADTLQPPTALVVTASAGTLVLTWGATASTYADGYYVYRAAASGGPYTNVATVAGQATATWTDVAPPAPTNWYKVAAYRVNWFSVDTALSSGPATATSVLNGTLTGMTLEASWTAVPGATSYTLNREATSMVAGTFRSPNGVAVAADGTVYVADYSNHRIRKVTAAGVVSTLAGSTLGSANGTGVAAQFNYPVGIAVTADGATVYVADTYNHRIRKVTTASGVVTTLAGSTAGFAEGTGAAAQFWFPRGVTVDTGGNVYVGDYNNHRIRKVTAAGVASTLAGSTAGSAEGTGAAAQFWNPAGVAVDTAGTVYVADFNNHRIRKVTAAGVASTLAGSGQGFAEGTGAAAQFDWPKSVGVDAGGTVYVADFNNHRIRKISPAGAVTTLAGSTYGFADGTGAAAQFAYPIGVAVTAGGTVYVGDDNNKRIRKVTSAGVVTTLAGTGAIGSADTGPVMVPSVAYSGTALSYNDTGLVADTSYIYTVTAVGPGTVSNTIGPFVP